MSKARQFILLSTPRSGTHMIRSVIDQHPEVCCYGEIFGWRRNQWYPECVGMTNREIEEWMLRRSAKSRVGFAIHIGGDPRTHSDQYWRSAAVETDRAVVYVFRRNQLRQTLSQYRSRLARAAAGGGYMSYRPDTEGYRRFGWTVQGLQSIGKIVVDCEEFHDHTVSREAADILFFAERRFRRVCPVAYEDFLEDPVAQTKRIMDFLRVDFCYFEPQTEKTGEGSFRDMIANIEAFHRYFSRTPYARWLADED